MSSEKIYSIEAKTIEGKSIPLSLYKGKVMLIVNVASQCGFTPQYEGLEKIYESFKTSGLEILAFPCNQFGKQEPGNDEEIKNFCKTTYDVNFPLFSKIEVNGPQTHPLYQFLKKEKPGFLGFSRIKWNFTKFLVGRNGEVLQRFAPYVKPDVIRPALEAALKDLA